MSALSAAWFGFVLGTMVCTIIVLVIIMSSPEDRRS